MAFGMMERYADAGDAGETSQLDGIEFCRIRSGRAQGHGVLTQEVPF